MVKHVIDIGSVNRRWGSGQAIEDRYRPMVAELETLARARPSAYRRTVLWAVLLGYAFILAVLLGLALAALVAIWLVATLHAIAIAATLALILPFAAWYALIALWARSEPPKGHEVKRHQAPELFALIDRVRHGARSPRVQHVLITEAFNAAIVQKPRLGILGWPQNYLLLGLPLLQALSPEEVAAVVAHEFGHLAGAHGTWAGWIYRTRQTWARLGSGHGRTWVAKMFQRFFTWYGPWFSARSFVLARHNEYHADRCSAEVAGSRHAASALTRVSIEGDRFARYWADLSRLNRVHETPVRLPYAALSLHFMQPPSPRDYNRALNVALSDETDMHDTHPCLADRLAALGEPMPQLAPVTRNAAGALLGDDLTARLIIAFDAAWWSQAQPVWEETFHQAQGLRRRLDELEALPQPLAAPACWELLHLKAGFGDITGAIATAEAHLAGLDQPAALRTYLGRLLLEDGQARGLDILQPVLTSTEPGLRLTALRIMAAYYDGFAPRAAERPAVDDALERAEARQAEIRDAFGRLDDGDVLSLAGLDRDRLLRLRAIACAAPFVRALWVARRSLADDPSVVQFVALFLTANRPAAAEAKDAFMQAILDVFGAGAYILLLEWDPEREWLRERMAALKGAQIYSDKKRVMKN